MPRCLVALSLLLPLLASAHDADVIYARLEQAVGQTLVEELTLTAQTLTLLAPVDRDDDGLVTQGDLDAAGDALRAGVWDDMPLLADRAPCTRTEERAHLEPGFIRLRAVFSCGPGTLRQDFKVLRVLPANYRVVLGSQLDGETGKRFAQGVLTALEVPRPATDSTGFRERWLSALASLGSFESLAALLVLLLSASTLRQQALRAVGVAIVAPVTAFLLERAPQLGLGSMLAALVLMAIDERRPLAALSAVAGALTGIALWLDAAGGSTWPAWGLAVVVVIAGLLGLAAPARGLLSRRAEARRVVVLGLAVVCVVTWIARARFD